MNSGTWPAKALASASIIVWPTLLCGFLSGWGLPENLSWLTAGLLAALAIVALSKITPRMSSAIWVLTNAAGILAGLLYSLVTFLFDVLGLRSDPPRGGEQGIRYFAFALAATGLLLSIAGLVATLRLTRRNDGQHFP